MKPEQSRKTASHTWVEFTLYRRMYHVRIVIEVKGRTTVVRHMQTAKEDEARKEYTRWRNLLEG